MKARQLLSLFTILLGSMLFANSSWAGNGYDNAYHHNAAYQQSHQQLLVSRQRLSQQAV
jgi:hypothetical protein